MRTQVTEKRRIYELITGMGIDGLRYRLPFTENMVASPPLKSHPFFKENPDQYEMALRRHKSVKENLRLMKKALRLAERIREKSNHPNYRNMTFDDLFNLLYS